MPQINLNRIAGLNKITDRYEGFLIDLWGVVHDGYTPYPGTIDCINQLLSADKKIIFVSNAPRPGILSKQKLLDYDINSDKFQVLTSGDQLRHQLLHFEDKLFATMDRRLYHLGAARNSDILAGIPADITENIQDADFILLTAYLDQGEDLNQFQDLFKQAIARNLPMVCANPDKIVINGQQNRYCAGFFAEQYEQLGGKVYYYGKPHLPIFELAIQSLSELGIVDKNKILMIGDTPDTDILGATQAGIDSLLVLTGNMSNLLKQPEHAGLNQAEQLLSILKYYGVKPTWITSSLMM